MAMYATPTQLAGWLQKDLDTYSATQALEMATERFSRRARKRWAATAGSWTVEPTFATQLTLPFRDITAVTAVKVNGVAVAVDYTLRNGVLYRLSGFGNPYAWPPDTVTIEFTYGQTSVPDDVKHAVLELAGALYEQPQANITAESIDDYRVQFSTGESPSGGRDWREVADYYRGLLVA